MKMLTKFESKSSRAKGVAFHPRRPWLLVSLHSSTIQLWDYRMGTLIDRFEDHDGPVRCVAFHHTQPIFVSGGDDYTIKVWSTQTRKCMFTFTGHLDYVRTVFFHEELPWIISASDDQTIRIWNWQNRKEIACLTGHNHYVMCAQFHPKQDLIVSASLDQTVRVWDISGLVKKHSMPTSSNPMNNPNSMMRDEPLQQDIFGNTDAIVKYVLEGHDKGVNWASFHPKLPLIISGGDDRSVKLWRMSDTRAWEVDGCRGHTNNVPCVLFHPTEDLIISVGEDKTIRSWDLNTRSPIKQFKRENDRFWMIVAHPHINLFAACHDSGVMVFKLDRERPASTQMSTNELLFINNANQIQEYNFNSKTASLPSLSLKKIAQPWNKIKNISYNNSEKSLLIQSGDNDNGIYSFFNLSKELIGATDPNVKGKGKANSAYFIARNRFVTFLQSQHKLDVHDLNDNITKSITLDNEVKDILPSHPGTILLLKPASVTLYDVQQKKELSTVQMNNAKYCVWSNDHQYLALLSKHTIIIVNKNFEIVMSMHETIRIKSAAFDDSGVLFYSTLNHIKYVLLNGDKGTIKTLENTMYIVKVQGKNCFCLNRKGEVECLEIDPTEYRFKKALINKKFNEVLRIIKGSNLVGENIIAYLEKSGYPEVALQFVQDPEVRFDLAIECHDLSTALVEAKKINSKNIWEKLGKEALSQGNMNIVELVYQQLHLLDKLSFLYLTTGETSKLDKMARIAESRDDISSLFTNSVYLGDVERKIQTFLSSGLTPLAYATAKSNGLEDIADKILENAGISADEISLPKGFGASNKTCDVLQPVNKLDNQWPLSEAKLSFFEQALSGNMENLSIEDREEAHEHVASSHDFNDNEAYVDEDDDELFEGGDDDAWDLGDEVLDVELQEENEMEEMDVGDTSKLSKELKLWIKNAKTTGAYIAAGKFDIAMNMLNKQACVKNFEPFKERFMEIYTSSKLNVLTFDEGANEGKTALINDTEKMLNNGINVGLVPGFEQLESLVQEGYKLFKANQLESSIDVFRRIIYIIATLSLTNEDEEEKCLEILNICKEYILGLRIELTRRALPATEVKRNLELASYFTCVGLQPAHRLNALQVAMTQSFKAKNFNHASYFANEFLKISSTGTRAEQARKIQAKSDSISTDSISIDFDPFSEFEICAGDFVPLYGSEIVREKLLGVSYGSKWKGKICEVTLVSEIGGIGSGLRLIN